ncbi:MAG: serine/threonine protein kinase [Deltaproteobacteria bacterium]|nr:serine/threonine protein kinase [Deltaproteobacteria bacterium]
MGSLGGIPLDAGDILAKKYRLEKLVGEGGTGVVVSAQHLQLEQRVAIKFLRTALASEEIRARFEREAHAIGQIESEHVVLVLEVGELEDHCPYMVMEFLEGRDLARVLKEDGPLPVEDAVDCMLQVCEALAQAHAQGIVHRDLKPANLFLTRTEENAPHVKVVDFGISKIVDAKLPAGDKKEMTNAFTVLGSPRYMAPEQLRNSKDVDSRADLWSVGAVLYQLVTGKYAFDAESNVHASIAVLTKEPRKLTADAPHVPPELEAVVNRCLTKERHGRYQSAQELAAALRPFASQRARDALMVLEEAKEGPTLDIALSVSSIVPTPMDPIRARRPEGPKVPAAPASAPAPNAAPVPTPKAAPVPTPLPSSPVYAGPPAMPSSPFVPPAPATSSPLVSARDPSPSSPRDPSRSVKVAFIVGGVVAVLLAFGILTAVKLAAQSMGVIPAAGIGASDPAPPTALPAATAQKPSKVITVPLDAANQAP